MERTNSRNDAVEEMNVIRVVDNTYVTDRAGVDLGFEAIRDALITREIRMARPVRVAVRAGGEDWRYYTHHRRPAAAVPAAALATGAITAA